MRGHALQPAAQAAYQALQPGPCDQSVVQRLDGLLVGGATPEHAAVVVKAFFNRHDAAMAEASLVPSGPQAIAVYEQAYARLEKAWHDAGCA